MLSKRKHGWYAPISFQGAHGPNEDLHRIVAARIGIPLCTSIVMFMLFVASIHAGTFLGMQHSIQGLIRLALSFAAP